MIPPISSYLKSYSDSSHLLGRSPGGCNHPNGSPCKVGRLTWAAIIRIAPSRETHRSSSTRHQPYHGAPIFLSCLQALPQSLHLKWIRERCPSHQSCTLRRLWLKGQNGRGLVQEIFHTRWGGSKEGAVALLQCQHRRNGQ